MKIMKKTKGIYGKGNQKMKERHVLIWKNTHIPEELCMVELDEELKQEEQLMKNNEQNMKIILKKHCCGGVPSNAWNQ